MAENQKIVRGASYPAVTLEKAIELAKKMLDAVGKAPANKIDVARAFGYSGINGKSKRVIAALIQYGLITGRAAEHQLTDLALQILFPTDEKVKDEAIKTAAVKPSLFTTLIQKYDGDVIPGLLPNILVNNHGINPKSGEEASQVFKETLKFAKILDDENRICFEKENIILEEVKDTSSNGDKQNFNQSNMNAITSTQSILQGDLNKIEIIIRDGVKAGIYAPHNLTDAEKTKLKTIIDLL